MFDGKRRTVLKSALGGAFASVAGVTLPDRVRGESSENCVQVDLIEVANDGIKDPIDAGNKYSDEDRLISWHWANVETEDTGENMDTYPYESVDGDCEVSELTDISFDFENNEADVTVEVSGCGESEEIDLALVSYEAPCGPGPTPGWDGSEQTLFDDDEASASFSPSVNLTVDIPSTSDPVPDVDENSINAVAEPPTVGEEATHGVEFDVVDADAESVDSITYEVDSFEAEDGDFDGVALDGDVDIGQDNVSADVSNDEGDELVINLDSPTTIAEDDTVSFELQGVTNPNVGSYDVTVAILDDENPIASGTATDELVISPEPESITLDGDFNIGAENEEATGSYTVTVDYGEAEPEDITVGLSLNVVEFDDNDINEVRAGPPENLEEVDDGSEIVSLVPEPIGALDVTALADEGDENEAQVSVEIDFADGTISSSSNFAAATGQEQDVRTVVVDTTGDKPVVERVFNVSVPPEEIILKFNENIFIDGGDEELADAFDINAGQFTNDVAPIDDASVNTDRVTLTLDDVVVGEDGPIVEDALSFTNGDGEANDLTDKDGNSAENLDNRHIGILIFER